MLVELRHEGRTTRMTYEDFESRVRDGQVPPDAEIRFEAATGDAFVPLRSLELYRELVHSDTAVFSRGLAQRGVPWITGLLVGIQLRIYLSSLSPGSDAWLLERFANWAPAALELGEVWRLISYGFLHLGLTHLAFNMLFIGYTGWNLERAMGRANLALIYLVSVFSGGVLSMAMSPDRPSLGASGGAFGLIAASVVFGWKYGEIIPPSARKYYGWAILAYLVAAFWSGISSPGVDNWGHLGGLVGGTLMVTMLDPDALRVRQRHNRRVRRGALLVMALVCGAMASIGTQLVPLVPWHHRGLAATQPGYWVEGWTFTGDRGSFSPTRLSTLVVNTTVHPDPLDINAATARFLEQVDAGGKQVEVQQRQLGDFGGFPSVQLRCAFTLSDEPYVMEALLVARGHYLHRVHMHSASSVSRRYRNLWARVLDRVELEEPLELSRARRKAEQHLSSWKAQADLAEALGRAGRPAEARRAWQRAGDLSLSEPGPLVGLMELSVAYQLAGLADLVELSLRAFPAQPSVLLAAAKAMDSLGRPEEADAILKQGWQRVPGEPRLQQALLQRGLQVPEEEAQVPG